MKNTSLSGSHLSKPASRQHTDNSVAESDSAVSVRKSENHGQIGKKSVVFLIRSVVLDIALAGFVICIFALFHHVIPTLKIKDTEIAPVNVIETTPTPAPTPVVAEPESEPAEEPVEDTRTEWQIRFEDKFTDEIVVSENHYSSPDICIDISTEVFRDEYERPTAVYVADVYIGSIDCFKTYFAGGKYISSKKDDIDNMIAESGAILAVNGDFANLYTSQGTFLVRNGEVFFTGKAYNCDICVLNLDGTMDMYTKNEFNKTDTDELLAKMPYNSWRFGPSLLDSEGHAKDDLNLTADSVKFVNPRAAIGYYEPGHYCFVACDGRSDLARGLSIWQLGEYFEKLGCRAAYNLDGGASAIMKFNGEPVNVIAADWRTDEERLIGDIVLIAEPETGKEA